MNVRLKPELEKFIAEKVEAGRYANASDIVNEALEGLREQEEFSPEYQAYLKKELQQGLEQLDRKDYRDFNAEKIIADERRLFTVPAPR